ncbi:MAG: cytochrome c biogenesis protein CcsA [Luteolibacter sp.]
MSNSSNLAGRWAAAVLVIVGLAAILYNVVVDNMPKGDVRKVEHYTPWTQETIDIAETIPVQNGGRIKPLSTYAGFTMLGCHGARSMEIQGDDGKTIKLKPMAWMLDALFRPEFSIEQPTFRVDNSAALEAIGVKPRGKRDRYSYSDLQPGRDKLVELAKTYEAIDAKKREPVQNQIVDLAYNLRNYEALLGYFGFARYGITLTGSGDATTPDQRADVSAVMQTAPQIRQQIAQTKGQGKPLEPRIQSILEQVLDASNFSKFGLFILPPSDAKDHTWQSAGNVIMDVMSAQIKQTDLAVGDIKLLESAARAISKDEATFRGDLGVLRDALAKRAEARGEYKHIVQEAGYYRKNWFLYAMIFFLMGSLSALGMWALGGTRAGTVLAWTTLIPTAIGLGYCITAITLRCIMMERPPIGNLYDTTIFIATAVTFIALLVELMTRRRFALGIAPILGTLLVILSRRFELGDAKDHMDPLPAVLNSNFWLTIHVITITLGYSAGLLSSFLSCAYLLMRGLGLDGGDKDLRRALTRAVYGMLCLTLFLSLVGTVLGGIWANYSWGRFWGWDPKENGALLIVLWTLAVLHARLGGYIKEWGIHFAAVFTAIVVTFSWWHVNFLGVGLHNYGFTAGKDTIKYFYATMLCVLAFGMIAKVLEDNAKARTRVLKQAEPLEA